MAFEILLSFCYALLFVYVILKASFFSKAGIPGSWLITVFIVKIIAGFALSVIYSKYYTDRNTADVFKFFDDSKFLFEALTTHPLTFLQIVFHVNSGSPEVMKYTAEMRFWYNKDILFNDN